MAITSDEPTSLTVGKMRPFSCSKLVPSYSGGEHICALVEQIFDGYFSCILGEGRLHVCFIPFGLDRCSFLLQL